MPGCAATAAFPSSTVPGHGRGGCVSWQDQPGDGGEAPTATAWMAATCVRDSESVPGVMSVCAVST